MMSRLLMAVVLGAMVAPPAVAQIPAGDGVDSARVDRAAVDGARTRNVIIVSIDGLRPDAIEAFDMSMLQRLMSGGSYTLDARTIFPSKTLPSHTSMLTGHTPENHGITFNQAKGEEGIVGVPTIFEIARARGLRTAAFYSKAKFRHLDRDNSYDYRQVPAYNTDNWMATRTAADAIQFMHHRRPNLLFVHIGEMDYAGHSAGWMSFFYGLAARRADAAVREIVEAADDTYGRGHYTLIVTSDHGGHGRDHGSEELSDMVIPWIVWGESVRRSARLDGVRTMDTAATALWLLGIALPVPLDGVPVEAAFSGFQPAVAAEDLSGR